MVWNRRAIYYEHRRLFEKILELHQLTEAWAAAVKEVAQERPSHFLDRGLPQEMRDPLWRLSGLAQTELESLLDDTATSDVLSRLWRTVWSVQAYSLAQLLERSGSHSDSSAPLKSVLEQVSWKLGRESAEKLWPVLEPSTRQHMGRLVLTLNDSPFGDIIETASGSNLLIIRATASEARFEMLSCAHQHSSNEVRSVADELCSLHSCWIKGFAYGLNPGVSVEAHCREHPSERCHCRWTLSTHASAGESEFSRPLQSLSR